MTIPTTLRHGSEVGDGQPPRQPAYAVLDIVAIAETCWSLNWFGPNTAWQRPDPYGFGHLGNGRVFDAGHDVAVAEDATRPRGVVALRAVEREQLLAFGQLGARPDHGRPSRRQYHRRPRSRSCRTENWPHCQLPRTSHTGLTVGCRLWETGQHAELLI